MNVFELKDPLVGLPMVTPLDENENVDLDAAEFNLEKWKKTSVDIFVVGTASGEELYISENEKVELLETVSKSLVGNKISAAGIDPHISLVFPSSSIGNPFRLFPFLSMP